MIDPDMSNKTLLIVLIALTTLCASNLAKAQQEDTENAQSTQTAPIRNGAAVLVDQIRPRTRLEATLLRKSTMIIKGYTEIRTIPGAQQSGIRILAVELTDTSKGTREYGLAIEVRQAGQSNHGAVSYVDYTEIDPLVAALESLQKLDASATRFAGIDASFRTAGDLEIQNVEQNGARVASIQAVQLRPPAADLVWATAYFDINQLADIAQQIQAAKQAIDASRATRENK